MAAWASITPAHRRRGSRCRPPRTTVPMLLCRQRIRCSGRVLAPAAAALPLCVVALRKRRTQNVTWISELIFILCAAFFVRCSGRSSELQLRLQFAPWISRLTVPYTGRRHAATLGPFSFRCTPLEPPAWLRRLLLVTDSQSEPHTPPARSWRVLAAAGFRAPWLPSTHLCACPPGTPSAGRQGSL